MPGWKSAPRAMDGAPVRPSDERRSGAEEDHHWWSHANETSSANLWTQKMSETGYARQIFLGNDVASS